MSEVNLHPSDLDQQQIIQQAYDQDLQRLRVDAEVSAVIGDVVIDAATSSVAIEDRSNNNFLHINNDGSIDVDVILSSTADSIAIGNQAGTNFLAVNADGSINTTLPSGASTLAAQNTGNTSLASIDSKLTSPITITGALTDTQLRATPVPVTANQGGTWNINNIVGTITLPTGASTAANQATANTSLASIDTKLTSPLSVTVSNFPATQAVTQSTSPWVVSGTVTSTITGPGQANSPINNVYSSTNVTTGAYVQLVASTSNAINALEIYDTSGQILYLATGGSGSEVNLLIIPQGGNGLIPVAIPASTRISVKAITATANSGNLSINFWK